MILLFAIISCTQEEPQIHTTPSGKGKYLEIKKFAANPGNLKLYLYTPVNEPKDKVPLVLSLHGCTQNALVNKRDTGWDRLADQGGFLVAFPETNALNHPYSCFRWFDEKHIHSDQGEALSIKQMIDYLVSHYPVDRKRIYITGLSAGAAMSVVMLAIYPELFEAGASIAGLPFRCASDEEMGRNCMGLSRLNIPLPGCPDEPKKACMPQYIRKTSEKWASLVKEQNPNYQGSYPRLFIWHGDADQLVDDDNLVELSKQWTGLHQVSTPGITLEDDYTMHEYMKDNQIVVKNVLIFGLRHGMSVDPGLNPGQGGSIGLWTYDKNIYSSYWIAEFFGIIP
jgi:poly(hydroxyalkanoate) depolymerase family esterase